MPTKSARFKAVDALLLALAGLPLVCGMVLKILTTPSSADIDISGGHGAEDFDHPILSRY